MLVRHGETISNVRHVLDSAPPGPGLTDLGHRQAAALADRMTGTEVAAVYASPAIRAQETATPLATARGLPVEVLADTHEVQVGDLEGKSDEASVISFGQVFHRWTEGDLTAAMPGGESGEQIRARFLAAVDVITGKHSAGLIVLVSHGGVIRLAAEWLADNVAPILAEARLLPNTGHVLLESRPSGWHCLEWTGIELV